MKTFTADDDMPFRSAAMSAIALATANESGEIILKYRDREIKVKKTDTINKVTKTWLKIRDEV